MERQVCPGCGCRLKRFENFNYGNLEIQEDGVVRLSGQPLYLPKSQYMIVDALVRAKGMPLSRSALANYADADINDETISKYIERVRGSFKRIDANFNQIECLIGFGAYRWRRQDAFPFKETCPNRVPIDQKSLTKKANYYSCSLARI